MNFFKNNLLINKEQLIEFWLLYKYYYLFILLTLFILLFFDVRIKYVENNKMENFTKFFLIFWTLLWTYVFILASKNNLLFLFQDIFWYTKIINTAFIFHVCWLYWLHRIFFFYLRWEKLAWIISRISFIFSLSFLLYLINLINIYVVSFLFSILIRYRYKRINNFTVYIQFVFDLTTSIIRFFMILFGHYTTLLLGAKWEIYLDLYKEYFKIKYILIYILYITVTFFLAIYLFEIYRIYLIWMLIFLLNFIRCVKIHLDNYHNGIYKGKILMNDNVFLKIKHFFIYYLPILFSEDSEKYQRHLIVLFNDKYLYEQDYVYPQFNYLYLAPNDMDFLNVPIEDEEAITDSIYRIFFDINFRDKRIDIALFECWIDLYRKYLDNLVENLKTGKINKSNKHLFGLSQSSQDLIENVELVILNYINFFIKIYQLNTEEENLLKNKYVGYFIEYYKYNRDPLGLLDKKPYRRIRKNK